MDQYTLIRKLEGHHNDVVSCEFSPDGALLATASYDTRVMVWDHQKGSVLLELGYLFALPVPHWFQLSAAHAGLSSPQAPLPSPLPHLRRRGQRPLGPIRELLRRRPPHRQRGRRPVRAVLGGREGGLGGSAGRLLRSCSIGSDSLPQ